MHVLPVLRQLEEKFAAEPVVVIGVHSAKFTSEKDPENVRAAMERHDVRHPVVVDSDHRVWSAYAVRAWPTIVVLDADGRIAHEEAGEADFDPLAAVIDGLLAEARAAGALAAKRVAIDVATPAGGAPLRFPGKVRAHDGRLYVSDTGHHRILLAEPDGRVVETIGSGGAGDRDGSFEGASFCSPQGTALVGRALYVADTENHLLRRADLDARRVETVAGTGRKGATTSLARDPRQVALRSPWDVCEVGQGVLVAMAGSHQIWAYDPARNVVGPFAGTGAEHHIDGDPREAAFAQPSGLCRAGRWVFVADSEASSVRAIDLEKGDVATICGQGLFDFGDVDGDGDDVRMQKVLDVVFHDGCLYVADAYNNKIRRVRLDSGRVETFCGDGARETFYEPGGLCVLGGRLYVADTNNHRVRVADLATGAIETMELRFP